jgi:hypothetical protein
MSEEIEMGDVATQYSCPTCREAGVKSQIVASGGNKLVCRSNPSGHLWTDVMEFKNLRPTMEFNVGPPVIATQTGHTTMQVSLPIAHKTILEAKMGATLNSTVAGILSMLAEGDVMIVPSGDIQRIKELINEKPKTSAELFGVIYAMHLRETEAKENERKALEEVKAYEGLNRKLVVVDLGDQRDNAEEKAKSESLPLKLYVEKNLRMALENNWF